MSRQQKSYWSAEGDADQTGRTKRGGPNEGHRGGPNGDQTGDTAFERHSISTFIGDATTSSLPSPRAGKRAGDVGFSPGFPKVPAMCCVPGCQEESYRLSMNEPRSKLNEQYPPDFNNFGNCCCSGGYGGGGGGGFGGGFGLGRAGNWLIAGAIAIAIADEINSGTNFGGAIVLPPPVSPSN